MNPLRIAGIDIGTNTALLLIADVDESGRLEVVHQEQRFPRLGKNVDVSKRISDEGIDTLAGVMKEYEAIIVRYNTERISCCATSAMRDAMNASAVIYQTKIRTGIAIELISGELEAELSYEGAISGLEGIKKPAVIDIGGGSTEITYLRNGTLTRNSLQLGAVRLAERALSSLPANDDAVQNAVSVCDRIFQVLPAQELRGYSLVGVAGTVTTLACLAQGLAEFDSANVNGYLLSLAGVDDWSERLCTMTAGEIESLSSAAKGRADILPAGTLILRSAMRRFGFGSITASDRGLRFGIVMREWRKGNNS